MISRVVKNLSVMNLSGTEILVCGFVMFPDNMRGSYLNPASCGLKEKKLQFGSGKYNGGAIFPTTALCFVVNH